MRKTDRGEFARDVNEAATGYTMEHGERLDIYVPCRCRLVSARGGAEVAPTTEKNFSAPEEALDWQPVPAALDAGWVRVRTSVTTQVHLEPL